MAGAFSCLRNAHIKTEGLFPVKDRVDRLSHMLMTRLKPRHFALLRNVGEYQSISRVALAMHVSQPAITKALKEVESIFMAQLFERTPRGLKPTPAGQVALMLATSSLTDIVTTAQSLAAIEAGAHGRISLGIQSNLPEALWVPALAKHLGNYPLVTASVSEGATYDLVDTLRRNAIDCVIGRALMDRMDEEVLQEPIYRESLCVLVSNKDYERLSRSQLDWSALSELSWMMAPPDTQLRSIVNSLFAGAGLQPPLPTIETCSLVTIAAGFKALEGAAMIVPRAMGSRLVEMGACRMLPQPLEQNFPPICLFTLRSLVQSPALEAFIAGVRNSALRLAPDWLGTIVHTPFEYEGAETCLADESPDGKRLLKTP